MLAAKCSTEMTHYLPCQICLLWCAGQCNQAWYCSEACRESHARLGTNGAQCPVPHSLACPVLSHFGGCKCDADMESVLHMCLDVLALQHLDSQARRAGAYSRINFVLLP